MIISIIKNKHISPVAKYSYPNNSGVKANTTFSYANLNNQPSAYYSKISFCGVKEAQKVGKLKNHSLDFYTGCLIGGAIGDALGAPIEFLNMQQIKNYYGENGIEDLDLSTGEKADVSDDTQMTFFTADGLLKSIGPKFKSYEIPDMSIIHNSYLDWLETQKGENEFNTKETSNRGWIANIPGLYAERNPGLTCLSALKSARYGTMSNPINNSKGNGGVMRVAPVGLLYYNNPKIAFEVGARTAAITHGHPSGYLSAGVFSSMIAFIIKGEDLETSIYKSIKLLEKHKDHEEVKEYLLKAIELATSNLKPEQAIKQIGGGWVGEEALAIAVYCALKSPDNFETAVKMSVNHDGDSDSTGSITGNLMGILLGENAIPNRWKQNIELGKELQTLASDLYQAPFRMKNLRGKYPYNMGRVPNWYYSTSGRINQKSTPIQHVKFSKIDVKKMERMSTQDKIEYKQYLIKNKLYHID